VSAFVGKGKKTAWQAWNVFENATEVFHCLSSPCDNLTQSEIGVLEEFAVIMYLEGDGKVGDLHSDCPQVCLACKTDLLICSTRAALEGGMPL
jgi:hypothetical protein